MKKQAKYSRETYRKLFKPRHYTRETVLKDREYGMFWYDWLWHVLRPVLVFACAALVVIGVVSTGWSRLYGSLISPPEPNDTQKTNFIISSGESVTTIGRNLQQQGFIRNPSVFKYYVQLYGLTSKLQSGQYKLSKDMDLFEVAQTLSSGKGSNERTIRILPGWTVEDIADYLLGEGAIKDRDRFLKECDNYSAYKAYSLALIGADETADLTRRTYSLEGYLAPDTYRVYLNADESSIVKTLVKQTDAVYNELFCDEDGNRKTGLTCDTITTVSGRTLTDDEIIILASIIEKEATTPEDMARVSAVFYNRLRRGLKLQSDPTVTYLSGITRLALTGADTSRNTAYNTYQINGLPVGPICAPSKTAIRAALYPDEQYLREGYMYFCATVPGSGVLAFSKTYEEHNAQVEKYRALWEAYDREHAAK